MLVSELAEAYLAHLRGSRGAPASTVRAYRLAWSRFVEATTAPGGSPLSLHEVTRCVVRAWLDRQAAAGLSAATIGQRLSAVRAGLQFAVDEGWLAANPAQGLKRPKVRRRLPRVLTAAEIAKLLDAPLAADDLAIRDRAILEVLFGGGLRAGELCRLRMDDLDPSSGTVRVLGKGDRERIVPLGRKAWEALDAYYPIRPPGRHVFVSYRGRPLVPSTVLRIVKRRAHEAGLTRRVWSHLIRHSAACALLRGGADVKVVQEFLGHANLATTSTYLHVVLSDVTAAYQRAHPRAA